MARELKVWGYTMPTRGDESERLGQEPHVRQCKAVVATYTKKEAIEKLGITQSEANGFLGQTGNEQDIAIAMSKPGQVFAHALNAWGDQKTYIEVTRQPHVPIKRPKRLTYEERLALWEKADREEEARTLNREELEYLIDMFADANNPVAVSIAAKAKLQLGDCDAAQ